jgi:hypothetical protein
VTKQPFLPDFPLTVVATAKRRLQAAIRRTSSIISRRSLSGYAVLFQHILPGEFLTSIDTTVRQRSFGHLPVFWAWLAQILEANASCQKAVSLIQSWCRSCKLPVPSSDTSSYCKARERVSLPFLDAIHQRIRQYLASRVTDDNRWMGFNLKAMDGSSVQLMDTPKNQEAYPQPSGQGKGCGHPTMGIVGLLNLGHGGWDHFVTCPHTQHDSKAAVALIDHLEQGDLLLADRAFCTYELIARSLAQGAHVLMRLHQARSKALNWKKGKRISSYERLVTWRRPARPRGTTLNKEEWNALPATLAVRIIKLGYENRDGKKGELIVVTTLTDSKQYCGIELADLYARRWDIELKLRDLKTTLGMEYFMVKSPEMALKSLWMSVIAFNLVRSLMQRAAAGAKRPAWHVSFKGVLDLIVASHERFRAHAGKPLLLASELDHLLSLCATRLIDLRPYRREPRVRKRRPKNYQLLTKPRAECWEIQQRSKYRKCA